MKIFSNFTIQKYVLATQQIYPTHQVVDYLLLKTKKWTAMSSNLMELS